MIERVNKRIGTKAGCGLVAAFVVALCISFLCWTHTLAYVRGADERSRDLWMAALKGFSGPVYYVGSEGEYSYFRAEGIIVSRFKAKTSRIRLPRTFAFGESEPYLVKQEMVPPY
jgi:hypothetical protein